jgi:hypothetical protein
MPPNTGSTTRAGLSRLFVLQAAVAVVVVVASALYILVPEARMTIQLLSLAALLLYVRWRYFNIPGVSGIPFSRTRKLFRGGQHNA